MENVMGRLAHMRRPAQCIAIWILNKIIIAFFVSLMAGLITPNLQEFFDSSSLKSRREVIRTIKNLHPEIDLSKYKDFRIVTADVLNLRQKPSMKSHIIAKLNRGKLVRMIQKKKNWTKVEVENSDLHGVQIGWVFTRYIVSINR